MYKLTSFTSHVSAEGVRLAHTYSNISDEGEIVEGDIRGTSIVVLPTTDENIEVLEAINVINEFLNKKLPK